MEVTVLFLHQHMTLLKVHITLLLNDFVTDALSRELKSKDFGSIVRVSFFLNGLNVFEDQVFVHYF